MISNPISTRLCRALALACLAALVVTSPAQTRVNKANWKLANRFTAESLRPYMYSMSLAPGWINKTSVFWYQWRDSNGAKFWRVDPTKKQKQPLFDSAEMAMMLSEQLKKPYDTTNLPINAITFDEKNNNLIKFTVDGNRFEYEIEKKELKNLGRAAPGTGQTPPAGGGGRGQGQGGGGFRNQANSFKNEAPDKKGYVYAQDYNLYYVEVVKEKDKDGKEVDKELPPTQLTKDGAKDYSFGSRQELEEQRLFQLNYQQQNQQQQQQQDQEGQGNTGGGGTPPSRDVRVRANVTWSKDSKKFFVTRGDERKVKDLYLVNSLAEPRPTLLQYKYSMPGEADVEQTELFVFDRDTKTIKKLPVEKYKDQRLFNIHFQETTSDTLRLVRRDRLQRNLELIEVDLKTDAVKPLLTESVENAFLETQPVRYVKPGGDFIWWSERNGWGHYYLYSNDGKLKNAITKGPFRASAIIGVDEKKNLMWVQAVGKEGGENPYYRHLYRVPLAGGALTLLDAGDADHQSSISEDKKYIVDLYSRTDEAPVAVLRDDSGKVMMELEKADLTRLEEFGWRMPEVFKVKAADGVTDIYGNMWKPTDFDPHKKYPIIANVYPGPQTESVTSTFSAAATNARLSQLGFIVIQIGNRGGNPARSNAYHSYGYYNLRDYGLADKKAGIEQLAARYDWIDIDRVGIYGHSGGGFMTAAALLQPPYNDFFKVGVSSSGNHDNNIYNQNWSEQHHGLREVPVTPATTTGGRGNRGAGGGARGNGGGDPDEWDQLASQLGEPQETAQTATTGQTKFEIKVPTNQELAANLKGNLLLVHGDMDNNVTPSGTIRLVNALIRANKRFDLMIMPGQAHGYGTMQPYFTTLMMEYFAEHLLGDYYKDSADIRERN